MAAVTKNVRTTQEVIAAPVNMASCCSQTGKRAKVSNSSLMILKFLYSSDILCKLCIIIIIIILLISENVVLYYTPCVLQTFFRRSFSFPSKLETPYEWPFSFIYSTLPTLTFPRFYWYTKCNETFDLS